MRFVAIDFETDRIAERETVPAGARRIAVSPFVYPRPRFMSYGSEGVDEVLLMSWRSAEPYLDNVLDMALRATNQGDDLHFVFHNCTFDIGILPIQMRRKFDQLAAAGRVHDTMLADILLRL